MYTFLSILYVLVCLFLIGVVLLQSGKGGGMGSAFGGAGGGSQTVFGGAGAGNFLTKATAVFAAAFMLLSMTLAYLSSDKDAEEALERAAITGAVEDKEKRDDNGDDESGAPAAAEEEPPGAMSTGTAGEPPIGDPLAAEEPAEEEPGE